MEEETLDSSREKNMDRVIKDEHLGYPDLTKDQVKDLMAKPRRLSSWNHVRYLHNVHVDQKIASLKLKESDEKPDSLHPNQSEDYELDPGVELKGDLRSLPIVIDEYSREYTRMINIAKVLGAIEDIPPTSEIEADKLRRQEQNLEAYTNVYDPQSGKYLKYHQLERKVSYCSADVYNTSWQTRYKKRKENKLWAWFKGLVNK